MTKIHEEKVKQVEADMLSKACERTFATEYDQELDTI